MYAVEFKADIENGIVHIPEEYNELQEKKNATIFVLIDQTKKTSTASKMTAISIDTQSYKFNRDEANER